MQTLTRFAFAVSDTIAWFAVFCLVFLGIPVTFFLPLFEQMNHEEVRSLGNVAALAGVQLALVMLLYATVRRKATAVVVLCLLPAWVWDKDAPALSLGIFALFIAVFALPYGLAYGSLRRKRKESQTDEVLNPP
jgi:hypothetical protein